MKQLETEYKNQISLETPDLWSRIEAGIDKYESEQKENAQSSPISERSKENVVNFKTRKIMYTIGRITAAAICILAIGATVNFFRGGRSDSTKYEAAKVMDTEPAAAATDNAAYEYESDAAFDAVEADAPEVAENSYVSKFEETENSGDEFESLEALFNIDYEGQLTEQLNELGFTNISDLTYQKLDVTRSSNIYSGSFINEDTGDKCSVDYIISIETIEIVKIVKSTDNEILYIKEFD
jgi:hypothetical protein